MTNNLEEDIQGTIENLLRKNPSKSYSKEEIIYLISSDKYIRERIEKILGEMEIWSSMEDMQSSVHSSVRTVVFISNRDRLPEYMGW
jgi:hypothetical protein